jgi:dTMP kinase
MTTQQPGILRRFIVLEGVDGAGTTTQLARIDEALSLAGVAHWKTAEPTGRPEGRLIRSILGGELGADPGTVAHLFAADRHEHLFGSGGIVERLGRGEAVVCDRYVLSSLAYQGVACGWDLPYALNRGFPLPELLIFFDVEPELSMGRIGHRGKREIYEELPFQERVRKAYEDALRHFEGSPMRVLRVDASLPVQEVGALVLDAVGEVLGVSLRQA